MSLSRMRACGCIVSASPSLQSSEAKEEIVSLWDKINTMPEISGIPADSSVVPEREGTSLRLIS
jgi:hypothetical protein